MKEPTFSGPSTRKMIQAISEDLDDLGFIEGKEFISGGRQSGRTTRLLKAALHQLDFMEPGEEIWVVAPRWKDAKRMCEHTSNQLAGEMGFKQEKLFGPYYNRKTQEGWKNSPDGLNQNRYFLTFQDDKHIHFVSIEALEHAMIGRRLTHNPAIFFDHPCYEYGAIANSEYDLYALLSDMV